LAVLLLLSFLLFACVPAVVSGHDIDVILAVACCWRYCCCLVTAVACIQTVAGILAVAGIILVPDCVFLSFSVGFKI
jgi:hypothetical protein